MEMILPSHLGGHAGVTHVDEGALKFFHDELGCQTMVDLGCGPGGQVKLARTLGYYAAAGIDGDHTQNPDILIDFTKRRIHMEDGFDLCWCVEFVEHVKPEFIRNYLPVFTSCKYVCMTASPPGHTGHHHVNCRPKQYWVGVMNSIGFELDHYLTGKVVGASTMKRDFLKETGMVFRPF